MHLVADVLRLEVLAHVLRQQVAPVRGRVDHDVARRTRDRPVERDLERLVAGLAGVEGEVVAEDDEALGPALDALDDVRQVDEVRLVDLDQPQAARRVLREHRLHQRRLAGAARAGEQHVVGRPAGDELARVAVDRLLLRVDRDELREIDGVRMRDGMQEAAAAALAPARRRDAAPVRVRGVGRQQRLDAREDALGAREERVERGPPRGRVLAGRGARGALRGDHAHDR